jgi:hypothetical protein
MSFKGSSKPIARPSVSFSKGSRPKTAAASDLGSLIRDDMTMEPSRDLFDPGPKLQDMIDATRKEILNTFSAVNVPESARDKGLLEYLRSQAVKFSSSDASKRIMFYLELEGKREDFFRLCAVLILQEVSSESVEDTWARRKHESAQ